MDKYRSLYKLTSGDSLTFGHLREISSLLLRGGFCLLPSDTGYSIASLPFLKNSVSPIFDIFPKGFTEPISLAFYHPELAEKYVNLTLEDQAVIENSCPGAITLVCEMIDDKNKSFIKNRINSDGTIGVRISRSSVENQLSLELKRPITTFAVRYPNGKIIQKFDDAVDIIKQMINGKNVQAWAAIKMPNFYYTDHSTVVTVQPALVDPDYTIKIFREGAIEPKVIKSSIERLSKYEMDDWC
jgi:tRNA A37 threonylcarbamoyladenosine synthetase subunit TsaC/SUA5/YrdC